MKFPKDIDLWLRCGLHRKTEDPARRKAIVSQFEKQGISSDSEIVHLYLEYGPQSCRGWYELLRSEDFDDMIEYAKEELEIDDDYLPITSIEGEGVTLYKKSEGSIYDVEYGELEDLESGTLKPVGKSFLGFLEWAKKRDENRG